MRTNEKLGLPKNEVKGRLNVSDI